MQKSAAVEKLLAGIAITSAFTALDFIVHIQSPALAAVPEFYYTNKIIYGSIYAIALIFALDWLKIRSIIVKSAIFAIVIAGLLQLRYLFYYNYSTFFHLVIFPAHAIILFVLVVLYFKYRSNAK